MKNRIFILYLVIAFIASFASAQTEKITNGDLESGTTDGWSFQTGGTGAATMEASSVDPISGSYSLKVTITSQGSSGWHIQLVNLFGITAGKKYIITFKARASKDTVINPQIQQNHDPYSTLWSKTYNVTTVAQEFKDSVINSELGTDANAKLTIWLGTISAGTEIWFDDVSVIETEAPKVEYKLKAPGIEKITNGKFEDGTSGWTLVTRNGASATFSTTTTNPIQGATSATISIVNSTGNATDIQLVQGISLVNDKRYFTLYQAVASDSTGWLISGGIIDGSSNPVTHFRQDTIGKLKESTHLDTTGYMSADDASAKFVVNLGTAPAGRTIYIDNISVIENTMAPELDIIIDGAKDAFYESLTNPNDGKVFLPWRAYLRDIGGTVPEGNQDISATVWSAWDRNYLYFYAEINDQAILCNNATNWSNDKLELKFDPDPTIISTGGALQVGMSALDLGEPGVDPGAVDNLDADKNLYYANGAVWQSTTDDYARGRYEGGYILEFRIPLEVVINSSGTRRLSPGVGGKFGLALNVADNDGTARESMLQWSAGFADIAWSNPQKHGTITFLEGNKLKWEAVNAQIGTVNDSAGIWYFGLLGPTLVESQNAVKPSGYVLSQNYPNPFNPYTTIEFTVPEKCEAQVELVNLLGQVVRTIVKGTFEPGKVNKVRLDASNLASGVYFYRLKAGKFTDVKKLVILK